jgi:hypothetical protein|tara:strand:- start:5523 stop:6134 length:612 start_codon:yes stop_codon:yes gene_type:complete
MPTSSQIEYRAFAVDELRVSEADGKTVIAGHAAVFNKMSVEMYGFREVIAPGAFADSLKSADVRALINHDPNLILGRNKAGTLRVAEDKKGLAIEIDPPDTQASRDLLVSMGRGDIDQMSFGFRTVEDKWETKDGKDVRTLLKVDLFDVSPVTFPAYEDTDVGVAQRSLEAWRTELEAGDAGSHDVQRNLALMRVRAIQASIE